MVDWSSAMMQSYAYFTVDPATWKDIEKIDKVTSCTINRDSETETIASATIDVTDLLGECYIRAYLITVQNGVTEKHTLGTFLVQTPSSTFDGRKRDVSLDAYSPLLELKENQAPIGYSVTKGENIMDIAYRLCREHLRAPVVANSSEAKLFENFTANTDDTWLVFIQDLLGKANYMLDLDELGRVLFAPKQDITSLQPVYTYDDNNSSILYAEISMDHDLYGIPNVVEVVYARGKDSYFARVVNEDSNSPTSTASRGREIVHRVTNPDLTGVPNEKEINEYARQLLRELSSLVYTVSYSHGYCPTRVGDCIRLNYKRAGITNVKARVIRQSITCEAGCPVAETAVFTMNLWR